MQDVQDGPTALQACDLTVIPCLHLLQPSCLSVEQQDLAFRPAEPGERVAAVGGLTQGGYHVHALPHRHLSWNFHFSPCCSLHKGHLLVLRGEHITNSSSPPLAGQGALRCFPQLGQFWPANKIVPRPLTLRVVMPPCTCSLQACARSSCPPPLLRAASPLRTWCMWWTEPGQTCCHT